MTERVIKEYRQGRIAVIVGDIPRVRADAIVNAANSGLLGGGGVDGAIHRAAGPTLLEECRHIRAATHREGLPAGEVVITGGGNLPVPWVIHTVGPVWLGSDPENARLLASCYRKSLELAAAQGLRSIAFPAIATGAYGYPKEAAAAVAWSTVAGLLPEIESIRKVSFVFFTDADADIFVRTVDA